MLSNLEIQILQASNEYYQGHPIMTDLEFDNLIEELKIENPKSEVLNSIGNGYQAKTSDLVVRKHPLKNLHGLTKIFVEDIENLPYGYYTPKYDGASVTLYYKNGKLDMALTRGDGEEGSDVTDKLRYIVPEKIDSNIEVISGEWIISKTKFKDKYPGSIAHRNIAVGFLMRKTYDVAEVFNFSFVAYRIERINKSVVDSFDIRLILKFNGFEPCPVYHVSETSNITYFQLLQNFKSVVDYNLDGLVYESGVIQDSQGQIIYNDEVAYKNNSQKASSVVTSIDWNFTRTGKYVPVVNYEPVELSGAVCSRATGYNAQFIINNSIGIGSKIEITRSGEIIPYILSSTPGQLSLPEKCSECDTPLILKGVDLVCPHYNCGGKVYSRLYNYIETVGTSKVKGASKDVIDAMIDYFAWKDPADVYKDNLEFPEYGEIQLGQASYELSKKVFKILRSSIKVSEMLLGLSISGVGYAVSETVSRTLLEYIESGLNEWNFQKLPGIGPSIEFSLVSNQDLIIETYWAVKNIIGKFKSEDDEIDSTGNKIKVCITGSLPSKLKKSEFYEKYKDLIEESDVKSSDYVISNKSDSSKTQQAVKLGKLIYSEEDFVSKIIPIL